jgi:hypothetical protein
LLALAFILSISLDIFIGLFLGYNETMKNITGGITAFNLWLYLLAATAIAAIIYLVKMDRLERATIKELLVRTRTGNNLDDH